MKRVIVCFLLLSLIFSAAAVSTICIERRSKALLQELEKTSELINTGAKIEALLQAEQTENVWKQSSLTFFIFLDHQSFSELDIILPMLSEYLAKEKSTANEQLLRCRGILEDLMAHQRLTPGNIF